MKKKNTENKRKNDSWSSEQDSLLVEVVLDFVSLGKTQREAFRAVSEKLKRTEQACGYRWNGVLRKKYQQEILVAQQKQKETHHDNQPLVEVQETQITRNLGSEIEQLLSAILSYVKGLEEDMSYLKSENKSLRTENKSLKEENDEIKQEFQLVNQVISRAKSLMEETTERKVS